MYKYKLSIAFAAEAAQTIKSDLILSFHVALVGPAHILRTGCQPRKQHTIPIWRAKLHNRKFLFDLHSFPHVVQILVKYKVLRQNALKHGETNIMFLREAAQFRHQMCN